MKFPGYRLTGIMGALVEKSVAAGRSVGEQAAADMLWTLLPIMGGQIN